MIVKMHQSREGQVVLAACDSDLLGKKIEEGNLQLDLTSQFYAGEEKTDDEIKALMKKANILNLVGKNTIKIAIEEGYISEEEVIEIGGVRHAQCIIGEIPTESPKVPVDETSDEAPIEKE